MRFNVGLLLLLCASTAATASTGLASSAAFTPNNLQNCPHSREMRNEKHRRKNCSRKLTILASQAGGTSYLDAMGGSNTGGGTPSFGGGSSFGSSSPFGGGGGTPSFGSGGGGTFGSSSGTSNPYPPVTTPLGGGPDRLARLDAASGNSGQNRGSGTDPYTAAMGSSSSLMPGQVTGGSSSGMGGDLASRIAAREAQGRAQVRQAREFDLV